MNVEEQLYEKYPKIFQDHRWGIAVDVGWYNILNTACSAIQSHIDHKHKTGVTVPQVVASQIKEKFGTLRFYYDGGDEYVSGIITMAENMSAVTCEQCGSPGELRNTGWNATLCEEHYAEVKARKEARKSNE